MRITNFRLCLIILFSLSNSLLIFSQDILWEKSYGGKYSEYLMDAIPTPDYGFIIAGSSLSGKSGNKSENNNGDLDYWIWKMDENGDLDWQKNFGGSSNDFLQSISLTYDGGFILGGTSSSNKGIDKKEDSKGQDDLWIIKLNADGNEDWQVTLGGEWQEKLQSVIQTKDGGFLIGASSSSNISGDKKTNTFGNLDYWIIKLDKNGKQEWQKSYGGIYLDEMRSLKETFDSGFIIGGYSTSPVSGNKTDDSFGVGDFWVIKTDKKGDIIWQKTLGGNQDDQLFVCHQTIDKGFILGGNSNSEVSNGKTSGLRNGSDFWIIKLDENGEISWQESYDFGNVDILSSIIQDDDLGFIVGGYVQSEVKYPTEKTLKNFKDNEGINDYIVLKINEIGVLTWVKSVGSKGDDLVNKVIKTRDGGYMIAGTSNPESQENYSVISNKNTNLTKNNGQVDNAKSEINNNVNDVQNDINKEIDNSFNSVKKNVNNTLGNQQDSKVKYGDINAASSVKLPMLGDNKDSNSSNNKKIPESKDKRKNYGNSDFWVVKLKDNNKPEKIKLTIEAYPNPTQNFTNVIIGYDFENGTATIVDLAGHVLDKFEIYSRTIPIDLSKYPEGIYIVNIKTNVQTDGIKIIKNISKN